MTRRSLLLIALPAFCAEGLPFVGRWRSVTTTKGGIGAVYEFDGKGVTNYSSCAIGEIGYRQEGGQLSIEGKAVGMGFHPDGRLQLNYGQNVLEDYTRFGEMVEAANPLLGEWRGTRVMAGKRLPTLYQFQKNGRVQFVIKIRSYQGRCVMSGAGWRLALPSLPARSIRYEAGNDQLVIRVDGGDEHLFRRL